MENQKVFKFVLKSKQILIHYEPECFNHLNQDILDELMTKHQYVVKSDIEEDIFLSFIYKILKNERLNITIDNFKQFEKLSKEFDYKRNLFQLYQNSYTYSQQIQNKKLKQRVKESIAKYEQKIQNYHQIIDIIIKNDVIKSIYQYNTLKSDLHSACINEKIYFINLFKENIIEQNGLLFILIENKKEAGVFRHLSSNDDVFIPRTIKHQSKEYIITRIIENSFQNRNLKSIEFPNDSEVNLIEKNAFSFSTLERIVIPSSVKQIENSAFSNCYDLTKVEFQKKSQLNSIESMSFYGTSIEEILIPSSVTQICEFSFCNCFQLVKIEFEENSQLKRIKNNAFENSIVKSMTIPSCVEELDEECFFGTLFLKNVKFSSNNKRYCLFDDKFILQKSDLKSDIYDILFFARSGIEIDVIPPFIKSIAPYAFSGCYKLSTIQLSEESQLKSIANNAFFNSSLKGIAIPSSVEELDDKCFMKASYLTNITISPKNQHYFYYDDKFILGKNDYKSDVFDVLTFARKDIKNATIPSFITHIASSAFVECRFLDNVLFQENSKLKSIGKYAFYESSLKRIKIPSNITKINECAFSCCDKIQSIEFSNKSKLKFIDESAFSGSSLKNIRIPSGVFQISNKAFTDCLSLKRVEFEDESELKYIGNHAFFNSSLECLKIPSYVFFIGKLAIGYCSNLQICEIDENCAIDKIDVNEFIGCNNAIIMIPVSKL